MADNMGVNPFVPDKFDPICLIKVLVADEYHQKYQTDVSTEDIHIVWFVKTLGNWKGLAISPMPDGAYFEVTYNASKDEVYVDSYLKVDHQVHTGFMEGLERGD